MPEFEGPRTTKYSPKVIFADQTQLCTRTHTLNLEADLLILLQMAELHQLCSYCKLLIFDGNFPKA